MTIQEATAYITDRLITICEKSEAAAIGDRVIEHLTGIKKTQRISHRDSVLTNEQLSLLESYLPRLLAHEPLQYVLNEAWFCGLKFYVDNHVLIPRPETEELVEWIITHCKFPIGQLKILDIGSGSGCIPVALKRRLGKAEVWSCDVSREALKVAGRNADELGVKIAFRELDFLSKEQRDQLPRFDIIVSNPPYIPERDKPGIQPNVLNYEPAAALFVPDNDPLVFYRAIAEFGKDHLNGDGAIYTEIHEDQGPAAAGLFHAYNYRVELKKDMQEKERMLKAGKQ